MMKRSEKERFLFTREENEMLNIMAMPTSGKTIWMGGVSRPINDLRINNPILGYSVNNSVLFPFFTFPNYLGNGFVSIEPFSRIIGYDPLNLSWDQISKREIYGSLEKINEIGKLKENWNGYGATIFSYYLIERAKEIVIKLIRQPFISPTARESIQMEYENESGDYLEFELFEGGRVQMFSLSNKGKSQKRDIDVNAINEVVKSFYGREI